MKIPLAGNDFEEKKNQDIKKTGEATIKNTYFGQEYLTEREAVDLISWLSTRLLVEFFDDGSS